MPRSITISFANLFGWLIWVASQTSLVWCYELGMEIIKVNDQSREKVFNCIFELLLVTNSSASSSIYRDYLANLDRYSVYVDQRPRRYRFKNGNLCSFVTRTDQALTSSSRLHFQCQRTLSGRFVYIEADGATDRWNKLFTAVLCEVFVYEQ